MGKKSAVTTRLAKSAWCSVVCLVVGTFLTVAEGRTTVGIPPELRSAMQERLSLFAQAQAEGRWDLVASMLGRYRRGGTGNHPYTQAHKECLISQMQSFPMTSFSVTRYEESTEVLSMPVGRRWWYLVGEAVFKTKSGEQKQEAAVVAYRDKGEWYFTPPNFDEYWEKTHVTEADLSADHADEIEIQVTSTSPLEIIELHAFLDKQYHSLRNLTFKLRNRTNKRVIAFTVSVCSGGGCSEYSAGHEIQPGSSREEKTDSSRYVYFCDGVTKDKITVESVAFADGSEWRRPKRNTSGRHVTHVATNRPAN
jgi:hypothetical protein